MSDKNSEALHKKFEITSVCRNDLVENFGEERALKFTNDEMQTLSSKMCDDYCEQLFWDSLEILAEHIESERK